MATKIAFDTHIARANLVSATCPAMFNEFKAISPKTQGENVKTLAQHFSSCNPFPSWPSRSPRHLIKFQCAILVLSDKIRP